MQVSDILSVIRDSLTEFSTYPMLQAHAAAVDANVDQYVLAIGKAASAMAKAFCDALPQKPISGYVLSKYDHNDYAIKELEYKEAGHPLPDENSIEHSREIVEYLLALPTGACLNILLSGGASSLFEMLPKDMSLQDFVSKSKEKLFSGIDITELNTWRSSVSMLKNGKALGFCPCEQIRVFALSDVKNNDPQIIGSGAFYSCEALATQRYSYTIIGDVASFVQALQTKLSSMGLDVNVSDRYWDIDVPDLSQEIYKSLQQNQKTGEFKPWLQIWIGESTLAVKGDGYGGRCTHLALQMASYLKEIPYSFFLALATDGSDGLTDTSGAWVDSSTWNDILAKAIDPDQALNSFNSHPALQSVGKLLQWERTGTNVNEVYIFGQIK